MILNENIVDTVTGQTFFSGTRVSQADMPNVGRVQIPMTWLSEHQTNLRIEKEVRQEHILSQRSQSLGKTGQNTPV